MPKMGCGVNLREEQNEMREVRKHPCVLYWRNSETCHLQERESGCIILI